MKYYTHHWNKTTADAKKILGNNASLPTAKMEVANGIATEACKMWEEFAKTRVVLKTHLADMQAAADSIKACVAAADGRFAESNFGLDPRNPEDKKKIHQAKLIFKKYFNDAEQENNQRVRDLDAFEKKLTTLFTPARPWSDQ